MSFFIGRNLHIIFRSRRNIVISKQLGSRLDRNTLTAEICPKGMTVCANVLFFNADLLVIPVKSSTNI